jgi:hypothetical protein
LIWRRHGDLATLIEQGFLKGSQKQVPPAFTISTPGYLVTGRPLSLVDAAIMVTLDDRSAMSQDAGSGKDRQEALRPFKTILAVLDLLDEESPEVRASLGRSLETLYLLASIRVGVQRDAGAGVIRLNSIGSQIATLLMTRRAEIPETGIQLNLDRGSSVVQRPREWVAEDLMEAVCDTAASVPWLHVECGKAMDWCASLYRKGWIETPPEQAMGKLLHRAVKNNSIPIARFALDHGADLTVTGDTQTTHTMTPIQAARALKRPEILSMIQSDLAKQAIAGVFESALGAESSKGVIPGAAPGAELEPTPGAAEGGEPTRRQKSPKAR